MWKALLLGVGITLATGLVVAQDHSNDAEKKVKGDITISSDTRLGQEVLKAGEYGVSCDTQTVTFTRRGENRQVVKVPCKGKELAAKSDRTEVQIANRNGAATLVGLLLKGSNIQHSFE